MLSPAITLVAFALIVIWFNFVGITMKDTLCALLDWTNIFFVRYNSNPKKRTLNFY